MRERLAELLKPPSFDDPDVGRRAALLYRILLMLLLIAVIVALATLHPALSATRGYVWATSTATGFATIVALWGVRARHVRATGILYSVALWLVVSVATVLFGGVQGPMMLAYIVVALTAGFFWGGRATFGFALTTSTLVAFLVLADARGLLPEPIATVTPANTWILLTLALTMCGLLLDASQRAMREAVEEARESEAQAIRTHHQLDEGRLMLEARARQQVAISELGQFALTEPAPEQFIERVIAVVAETLEVDHASMLEHLPETRQMHLRAGVGWPEEPSMPSSIPESRDTLAGAAMATGEPVVVEDLERTSEYPGATLLRALGVMSAVVVVVAGASDQPFGSLGAFARRRRFYSDDDVTFMQAAANLITLVLHRTEAERTLRQRDEELRQSQKMDAVGKFAGGIAHDFNNLLMAIMGNNRFLLQGLPDQGPNRECAEEIQLAADRAAALTQQILAISRRQILEPRVLDLNEVIRDTQNMLDRVIGEDVQLASALADDLDPVFADPGQIVQVLLNLTLNARDAMPRGGTIRIETNNQILKEESEGAPSGLLPAGHYIELSVLDNGTGIPAAIREQMFEPFFTTKERTKGTGLGLSTVYGIVTQSGGDIRAESTPGDGASFHILLPRSKGVPEVRSDAIRSPIPRGSETILLAEDDPTVRRLVKRVLEEGGYRLLSAEDGARAIEMARKHPEPIDLLISDVIMPTIGGAELAELLRECHPEARVLFISGYADDLLSHHGVASSGSSFLAKPFSFDDLAAKVRETLEADVCSEI